MSLAGIPFNKTKLPGISCMTPDNFCFYLQNRLIQTSQTGGQWYSDTSPCIKYKLSCPEEAQLDSTIVTKHRYLEIVKLRPHLHEQSLLRTLRQKCQQQRHAAVSTALALANLGEVAQNGTNHLCVVPIKALINRPILLPVYGSSLSFFVFLRLQLVYNVGH